MPGVLLDSLRFPGFLGALAENSRDREHINLLPYLHPRGRPVEKLMERVESLEARIERPNPPAIALKPRFVSLAPSTQDR